MISDYRTEATYAEAEHRLRFVELFDEAIERLEQRPGSRSSLFVPLSELLL